MQIDSQLRSDIALRAECRKQELIEALGGNVLLKSSIVDQSRDTMMKAIEDFDLVKPWCKNSGGKENKSPCRDVQGLYPCKPPRSVYNSPLTTATREALWREPSPPPVPENTPVKVQTESTKGTNKPYLSPFKNNREPFWKFSQAKQKLPGDVFNVKSAEFSAQPICSQDSGLLVTAKITSTPPRLYPKLPPLDSSSVVVDYKVEEKFLKDHSNWSTANASRLKPVIDDPGRFQLRPLATSTLADPRRSPASINCPKQVFSDAPSASTKSENKDSYQIQSADIVDNDIEDTFDMDRFLEEALGSQLDLCSSLYSEPSLPDLPKEEPLYTLSCYRTLNKRPSSSTLKSSMQHLSLLTPSDEAHSDRMDRLMKEADKQQQLMVQTSKALYLCRSSKAFSLSMSLVEGERLLLLASLRHQAVLTEIQKMPCSNLDLSADAKGSIKILDITTSLKSGIIGTGKHASQTEQWFMCVLSYGEQVAASKVVAHEPGTQSLNFPGPLELTNLPTSFKAVFQVYTLRLHGSQGSSSRSKVSRACKLLRRQSKSCLGPAASSEQLLFLRSPAFALTGSTTLSLEHVREPQPVRLCLDKVPLMSPLQGNAWLSMKTVIDKTVETTGFLNVLEQTSTCHVWQRRWCYLDGLTLRFWNYPTDQDEKDPVSVVDLRRCNADSVSAAPRHFCARARTLMLETIRSSTPHDLDSTLLTCTSNGTVERHFISCDTVVDMNEWSVALNQALRAIRKWKITLQ